jgi:signal transduction histidine kinase
MVRGAKTARGIWSAEELRRAVWNLASNAVKYGSPGSPIVFTIDCTTSAVAISVHNRGTPIPPDEQATLFTPFSQSRSRSAGGTPGWGLGLTLVRGCAEAHGGSVHVESDAEAGTTFTIVLPLDARPFQT